MSGTSPGIALPTGVTADSSLGQSIGAANNELDAMNQAFEVAIEVNAAITVAKTVDGAEETVAQQRPNIG